MRSFGDAMDRSSELEMSHAGRADCSATGTAEDRSRNDRGASTPLASGDETFGTDNPIIRWLEAEASVHGPGWLVSYFELLAEIDRENAAFEAGQAPVPLGQRFAAALYVDFAERHGLTVDELAGLMSDCGRRVGEAIRHLVSRASAWMDSVVHDGSVGGSDEWLVPALGLRSADPDQELDDEVLRYRRNSVGFGEPQQPK